MIGERYFATRERLSEVMTDIAALAAETGADVAGQLPLAELAQGLGPPFLFVVCGETNAGKSTFLNGLFGCDLCSVNRLPETTQVLCYRHGEPAREPGILAVPLKIAAPDGDAVDVDGGAEDHVAAVGAGFRTDGCALLLDEIGIPGGSHGDAGGEGGGEDWGCGSCGVGDEG